MNLFWLINKFIESLNSKLSKKFDFSDLNVWKGSLCVFAKVSWKFITRQNSVETLVLVLFFIQYALRGIQSALFNVKRMNTPFCIQVVGICHPHQWQFLLCINKTHRFELLLMVKQKVHDWYSSIVHGWKQKKQSWRQKSNIVKNQF